MCMFYLAGLATAAKARANENPKPRQKGGDARHGKEPHAKSKKPPHPERKRAKKPKQPV